jgi:TPR repeat protein
MEIERAAQLICEERGLEALAILEPLAAAGSAEAIALQGLLFQLGTPDLPPNGTRAEALLLEAVSKGSGVAAHNLGTLYITGAPGFEPKPELGKRYYQRARDLGFQVAPDEFYQERS